jgi:hypothetical protein
MSCDVTNIRIEPADASWEVEESWCVQTVADVSSSLNNKWFKFGKSGQTTYSHYAWFNVAAGGVDPAIAGLTAVPVAIAANATAAAVATALNSAIDALSDFESEASNDEVTIRCATAGMSAGVLEGTAATGFTFTQEAEGGDLDLGLLDGDIEVSFEQSLFEVTAHQTGTSAIAELRQGVSCEITLTLKEVDNDTYSELFNAGGGTDTPSGGTEVFGWGKSRQGSNTIVQARRLVLHPVRLASNVYTDDFCAWKAYPLPESIVYSGENPKLLNVTFKCYLDDEKPDAIQLFAQGDWTQYVPFTV